MARGLLLYGPQIESETIGRKALCGLLGVEDKKFRNAAEGLGAVAKKPGLRFFDASREKIRFGPGAGVVLSASLGSQSLRGGLVDANGTIHFADRLDPLAGQLELKPNELLERLKSLFSKIAARAFEDEAEALLVGNSLPLLGVSVAWPAPVTRDKRTVGNALRDHGWDMGDPLDRRVAQLLKIPPARSHALNDSAAAAIAIAYKQTVHRDYLGQNTPRLAMVLRLAGGIGAATIVVEPRQNPKNGIGESSGFDPSILTGGVDHLAGEIGHVPVEASLIDRLNQDRPSGLGELEALACSCGAEGGDRHLEAFASAAVLARRVDAIDDAAEVVNKVVANPEQPVHARALADTGKLIAGSLAAPVAMLNPARIVLTGALGVPAVADALQASLAEIHALGTMPEVDTLEPEENEYIRVLGAGMVVIRREMIRKIPELLGGGPVAVEKRIRDLTHLLPKNPW